MNGLKKLAAMLVAVALSAYDCGPDLADWTNRMDYTVGDMVGQTDADGTIAYRCTIDHTSGMKNRPIRNGSPWESLGPCDSDPTNAPVESVSPAPIVPTPSGPSDMQIFGVWHCGDHYCDWAFPRVADPNQEFDMANRWLIDRFYNSDSSSCEPANPGTCDPSVNLLILSFLEPWKLYTDLTDSGWLNGVPRGMTSQVVDYFKLHGIKVMVSMGGAIYADEWDQVLADTTNGYAAAKLLAQKARALVMSLGLWGLEIDYQNGTPTREHLEGMEAFINKYRLQDGIAGMTTMLTLDLAVGNRYPTDLSRLASAPVGGFNAPGEIVDGLGGWLASGKIDDVNAMVPGKEPQQSQWQEHVDGMSNYSPIVHPKPASKVALSQWLIKSKNVHPNCDDFAGSPMNDNAEYVTTNGFLGYMFWAAESTSPRRATTTPDGETCEGGMGIAATEFNIPIPLVM